MEYDLKEHLGKIYTGKPKGGRRPVIGISANFSGNETSLCDRYYNQIVEAGGTPLLIPPVADSDVITSTLSHIDGLLLSGGADFNPLWCGEEPSTQLHGINATRDLPELLLTRLAYNRQIPMLGICRGIQTLVMALGGEVAQDIKEEMDNSSNNLIKHSQDAARWEPTHSVSITKGSILHHIYDNEKIYVNSFHHQAVRSTGKRFTVSAKSVDGVIEAIESCEHKSIMGVQWHPEWLGEEGGKLFSWLVERSKEYSTAKNLHDKTLTIDTHCDTPMFFPQGVDFGQRDERILVDLHKMYDGRQDAVFMVCYLPQPKSGEKFTDKVAFDVSGPKAYTDLIFDKIGDIVYRNSEYLALARTSEELYTNKANGKKSIVLGIENGLALEDDINNIAYFANRGVKYITLCHNGDNSICDSARGEGTHNGVSPFGEKVIREMNRIGIMVDMSHASEKSFYDALDISSKPIVCSHSNSKALCDVPRNLTDDQLRALAKRGGVAHTTLYHGFLRKGDEASIYDAIAHLEHAIDIMGIDHVGIGTDFDGDGGVPGFADASEAINFTMHLLRRKYSEEDIRKIWGGNWIRVMNH